MKGATHMKTFRFSVWPLLFAISILGSSSSAAAVLLPGEQAPPIAVTDGQGNSVSLDIPSTNSLLLVFIKPGDRYTSETLHALDRVLNEYPPLAAKIDPTIIISRSSGAPDGGEVAITVSDRWRILWDAEDRTYRSYKIIATPTVVLVGPDGTVEAVNPGYDTDMSRRMRSAMAHLTGVNIEPASRPAPPNLTLQMARRMASRGLWDSALEYYRKSGDSTSATLVEMALIHLEIEQFAEAEAILNQLRALPGMASQVEALQKQIDLKKAGSSSAPAPPKVVR